MTTEGRVSGRGTLLIVEDEPMIGRILEHKLHREGWLVRLCRDTAAAEAVLRAEPVELALVDATLDRDGLEWAEGMAASGLAPARGWLAMVEARTVGAPALAMARGAAGVVVKPFKPSAVAAQVERVATGAAP